MTWEKSRPAPSHGELWEEIQEALAEAERVGGDHFPGHPNYVLEQLLYGILLCQADAFARRNHIVVAEMGLGPFRWGRPDARPDT